MTSRSKRASARGHGFQLRRSADQAFEESLFDGEGLEVGGDAESWDDLGEDDEEIDGEDWNGLFEAEAVRDEGFFGAEDWEALLATQAESTVAAEAERRASSGAREVTSWDEGFGEDEDDADEDFEEYGYEDEEDEELEDREHEDEYEDEYEDEGFDHEDAQDGEDTRYLHVDAGEMAETLEDDLRALRGRADARDRILDRLRALRGPDPALRGTSNAAVTTFLRANLRGDDLWLAEMIAEHGPETHWDADQHNLRHSKATRWPREPGHIEGILLPPGTTHGTTVPAHSVRAIYFPGSSAERALVIGGVHGSETAAADTALDLVARLRGHTPYFTTIVIPELFAANVAAGRAYETSTGRSRGDGLHRTTTTTSADPNRQFPGLGEPFNAASPLDVFGATIELENQVLLDLIQRYRPSRVASFHEIHSSSSAGIFADSRTDGSNVSARRPAMKTVTRGSSSVSVKMGGMLEYENTALDWALAICMAEAASRGGATVTGNRLGTSRENAAYGASTFPARGTRPDKPSSSTDGGVSGGNWGSEAVPGNRPSITWITVEIQQRWRVTDRRGTTVRPASQLRGGKMPYPLDPTWDTNRIAELAAFRDAVKDVFLANSTCPATKREAWHTSGRLPRI